MPEKSLIGHVAEHIFIITSNNQDEQLYHRFNCTDYDQRLNTLKVKRITLVGYIFNHTFSNIFVIMKMPETNTVHLFSDRVPLRRLARSVQSR